MKSAFVCFFLVVYSCAGKENAVKSFIPGSYVRAVISEFSIGQDTLVVSLISEMSNTYRIQRRCSYQRIFNDKLLPGEKKVEEWLAIYDPDKKILNESRKGKVMSFVPERKIMLVGKAEYNKIN